MLELISTVFDTSDFPARWHCGVWSTAHGVTHIVSDLAIASAYAAIPIILACLTLRRRDIPFLPVFWLFCAFIISCGLGHVAEAVIFWHPWYRLSAALKVCTAIASWATVVALVPVLPRALALPGLAALNAQLSKEIAERQLVEVKLRELLLTLEERVQHRTNELKLANDQLAEREEHVHTLLDSTVEAIYGVDLFGNCTFANRSCVQMIGCSDPGEVIGKNMHELIHHSRPDGSQYPAQECRIFKAIHAGKGTHVGDEVLWRRDGTSFPVEYWSYPILRNGSPTGAVVSFLDISERLQVSQELAQRNQDLETMLYVTSHDLREPLRSIESFSRLVHDRYAEQLDEKGKDFLGRVIRATSRLDQLLQDVLTLSRAQRMVTPTETVPAQEIIKEAIDRLTGMIERSGAQIEIEEDLPALRVDRLWANQAIYNLLANALKFVREGASPQVSIGKFRQGQEQGLVVRDRGPGIEPQYVGRVFKLFQRAVGREVEGTGTGLAIVAQIAQSHGGRAWHEPRDGGGSQFFITFASKIGARNPK